MNYNRILQAGRLTRKPELTYTPNGSACCKMSIAVNDVYVKKGGDKTESVYYIDVVAWGNQAENAAKYLDKGSEIFVEGRLKQEEWTDKATDEKRRKFVVYADNIQYLSKKKADGSASADNEEVPF